MWNTMRWTVSNAAAGCGTVRVAYLLLVFAVLSSGAVCRRAGCRANRPLRVTNSTTSGRHVRSYVHLQGDVRQRKLFSFQKFFLRIGKDGRVNGTKSKDDPYSEFSSFTQVFTNYSENK